jgi:hypothetical protein
MTDSEGLPLLQVLAAMGPPGGARNAVDPRFVSLFNCFEVQFPSNENLRTIYQVGWGIQNVGDARTPALAA